MLKMGRATLYRLRQKGLPYKKINRSIRYDEIEVKNWIDNQGGD